MFYHYLLEIITRDGERWPRLLGPFNGGPEEQKATARTMMAEGREVYFLDALPARQDGPGFVRSGKAWERPGFVDSVSVGRVAEEG